MRHISLPLASLVLLSAFALPAAASADDVDLKKVAISVMRPPLKVGEDTTIYISVKPFGSLTVKQDAPFKVVVNAPPDGLEVPVRTLDKPNKITDRRARFNVTVKATRAGTFPISGSFSFTVCSKSGTCKTATKTYRSTVKAE